MPTTHLLLVTPGLTAAGRVGDVGADEPLDPQGRRQVAKIDLGAWVGASVRSAPEAQCVETATVLASPKAAAPTVDTALADWDLGRWRGRPVEAVATEDPGAFGRWRADPAYAPHAGESLDALVARATLWINGIGLSSPGPRLVAVAPAAVVRALLVAVVGGDAAMTWSLDVEPAACVQLTVSDRRTALRWPTAGTGGHRRGDERSGATSRHDDETPGTPGPNS